MDLGIISVRYAKALLKFAIERKEEDSVYNEMNHLVDAFQTLPQFQAAMQNPVLKEQQKSELLKAACTVNAVLTASTKKFIDLVTSNKRADLMLFIAYSFEELYRKEKRLVKGRLIVAKTIGHSIAQRLQDLVEHRTDRKVEFKIAVDKKIEGGFILEYDTYRLDCSLKTQIDKLHRALK